MIRQICTTWRMMPVARAGKALALPVGPKRYLPSPWHLVGHICEPFSMQPGEALQHLC